MGATSGFKNGTGPPEGIHDAEPLTLDLRVLVVEDDEADAYLIQRALNMHPRIGEVYRAVDGIEALDLIDDGVDPDFAIIDLHMPRKNGFSLLLEFGCMRRDFPMIVLTSSTARSDAVRSKLRGAAQVLTKPDTVEELEQVLANAVAALTRPAPITIERADA